MSFILIQERALEPEKTFRPSSVRSYFVVARNTDQLERRKSREKAFFPTRAFSATAGYRLSSTLVLFFWLLFFRLKKHGPLALCQLQWEGSASLPTSAIYQQD